MTIAFDAVTQNSTAGDVTITHTPVGTPRGVLILMVQNTATDFIDPAPSAVTYGGVNMAEISGSPLLAVSGDEDMALYGFFLGSSIPTGAQSVTWDTTSTPARSTVVITVTAATDTEIDAVATQDAVEADPSVDLSTTASTNTFVAGALGSGHGAAANIAPDAAYTQLGIEQPLAAATICASFVRRTTNPTGGTVTVNWTALIEDAHIFAVAVREVGGAAASVVDPFGMSGFFGA